MIDQSYIQLYSNWERGCIYVYVEKKNSITKNPDRNEVYSTDRDDINI
jgi:hypothetical protein